MDKEEFCECIKTTQVKKVKDNWVCVACNKPANLN